MIYAHNVPRLYIFLCDNLFVHPKEQAPFLDKKWYLKTKWNVYEHIRSISK